MEQDNMIGFVVTGWSASRIALVVARDREEVKRVLKEQMASMGVFPYCDPDHWIISPVTLSTKPIACIIDVADGNILGGRVV